MSEVQQEPGVIELSKESFSRRDVPAVQVTQATSLVQALAMAASDPRTDMDKMERLFAMHQKMLAQEAEAAFNGAMSRAQAKIVPVANNAMNSHTSSRYAKLAAINKAITPLYTAEGLSISFDTADSPVAGKIRIIAFVSHAQGHTRQYHIDLALDDSGAQGKVNKTSVQATGSTNSYGRRYLVCMIFNVATEDDMDGNDTTKGMTEAAYQEFSKKIEAATTEEKALDAWREGLAECEKIKDKESAKALREVLRKHRAFIAASNKAA